MSSKTCKGYKYCIKRHITSLELLLLSPPVHYTIATQILVIAKLNGREDFILGIFNCDIIRPSKELLVQS